MRSSRHLFWIGLGVCVAALGLPTAMSGCRKPSPSLHHVPFPPKPEEVLTTYLQSWVRQDYETMWQCLSDQTQKHLPKSIFVKRITDSDKRNFKVVKVIYVRTAGRTSPHSASLEYQIQASITAREADKLKRRGFAKAKPGLWTFRPAHHTMVREKDGWRIQPVPPTPAAAPAPSGSAPRAAPGVTGRRG